METSRKWGSSSGTRTIRLGRGYSRVLVANMSTTTGGSRRPLWKLLWRKLFKEKIRKTMLEYSNSVHLKGVPKYDEYTYSQNFDEGLVWDEIDGLSRSFSVRFADPTIIFFKKGDM
ncbi:uncharacterized protein LOC131302237 [Rhododendron vialii]|uniref:uncharacterized protein LOC131302237 n=1 Tax=Rhododendron vialii TaxID=182163 RepID=UPI00265EBE7B|nr:uncharacterized protein LOC131302237 [Rhododendron vialii]